MLPPKKPIFASFRRIIVGHHDTEGFASLHPRLRATRSARAFDLSGRAAVKLVIVRRCVMMPELKESPLSQIVVAGVILLKKAF